MSRILKTYDRSIFELTSSFTVVTFPFETSFIGFIPSNDKIIGKIKEKPRTTLDVIRENPTATIARLSELAGKSQSTIARELKEYRTAGLIRRVGARKNGSWAVIEN